MYIVVSVRQKKKLANVVKVNEKYLKETEEKISLPPHVIKFNYANQEEGKERNY